VSNGPISAGRSPAVKSPRDGAGNSRLSDTTVKLADDCGGGVRAAQPANAQAAKAARQALYINQQNLGKTVKTGRRL
jgi:hypothetical protein